MMKRTHSRFVGPPRRDSRSSVGFNAICDRRFAWRRPPFDPGSTA